MENASKALIMAAGVLIGILILSLAVFLFIDFGTTSQGIYNQMEERQLTQYNAQYTIYNGRTDITIYDIITLANLAKENNEYYEEYTDFESTYKVTIKLDSEELQGLSTSKKQERISKNSEVDQNGELIKKFTCNTVNYHNNGRVSQVIFKTNH